MVISPGLRVGKYEIKRLLGQGGFGMVFAVHDTKLDRECAMKFLLPEHTARQEILQRFLKEARSAAKIKHAGIVTVFECDVIEGAGPGLDGMAYIAMELLEGESLSGRLRNGPLPIDHAVEISRQVASALSAAHAVGIIHRDLKPDNIYLVPDPATTLGERVKVLDFGIVKLADDAGGAGGAKTSTHMIFGTPKYMSPEQCKSTAKVDERSDIYALGCILFEMVTGRAPFEGDAGELIAMQQLVQPPAASSLRADLPPLLDAAISAMLAKQPTMRPSTMTDIVKQLGSTTAAMPAVASRPAGVAPTIAPNVPTYPPAAAPGGPVDSRPAIPTPPPTGIPLVLPAVAVDRSPGASLGPAIPASTSKRSPWPFVAIGGLAIVGGTIAIIALGGGRGKGAEAKADAGVKPDAGTTVLAGVGLIGKLIEIHSKALDAASRKDCADLGQFRAEAKAVSRLIFHELAYLRCDGNTLPGHGPDPAVVYAVLAASSIVHGSEKAKVTIVEASDYLCPYCFRVRVAMAAVAAKYGDQVRFVMRPKVVHKEAKANALAACAAARQGAKQYKQLDDAMWAKFFPEGKTNRAGVDPVNCWETRCPNIEAMAQAAGLDVPRLGRDMKACLPELDAAEQDWDRFQVTGIPQFFINGRSIMGFRNFEGFAALIDAELAKADQRIASGTRVEDYYQKHVIVPGTDRVPAPATPSRASPDPLESTEILARQPQSAADAYVVVIGWDGSSFDPRSRLRGQNDAHEIAGALAATLRTDADPEPIVAALSEESVTGLKHYTPEPAGVVDDTGATVSGLVLRLQLGEVGLVRSRLGWIVAKRAVPKPDPLDSVEILARPARTLHARVKHILLGWDKLANDPRALKRTRAELDKLVRETVAKLAGGAAIDPLMKELSEDPGTAGNGHDYEVKDDSPFVPEFVKLALRLDIGEVGVVKTTFGIHIMKRIPD